MKNLPRKMRKKLNFQLEDFLEKAIWENDKHFMFIRADIQIENIKELIQSELDKLKRIADDETMGTENRIADETLLREEQEPVWMYIFIRARTTNSFAYDFGYINQNEYETNKKNLDDVYSCIVEQFNH